MPGRNYSSLDYRYGFNGKENDPEAVSTGEGLQDYGMRIYNPSLGRFLSVDPVTANFPWWTPYQFAGNNPIHFIDLDGLEPASPEQKQKALDIVTAHETDKDYSQKFYHITATQFFSDLKTAVNDPGKMVLTGTGNYCGLYAIAYVVAYNDPETFVKTTLSLFETGTATLNGKTLTTSDALQGAYSNGNAAAFIFSAALRETDNNFRDYDPGLKSWWSSTVPSTMESWLNLNNFDITKFSYGYEYCADGITLQDLATLKTHIDNGYQAVLYINSDTWNHWSSGTTGTSWFNSSDLLGGDHFIVLQGNISYSEKDNTISFDVYDDHGGTRRIDNMPLNVFTDMINEVMMIQPKSKQ